jgi:hypothetical protein
MITTAIILGLEGNFPIWHKSEGFAKNEKIAKWLFEYCGWKSEKIYPELAICEEIVEAPELDMFFPCNMNQLWVIGSPLFLN